MALRIGLLSGTSGGLMAASTISPPVMAQVNSPYGQPPAVMKPGLITAGQGTIAEDAAVYDIPLRWPESLRLSQPVVVRADGEAPTELAVGTLLSRVLIDGEHGQQRKVYCSRYRGMSVEMPRAALFPGGLLLRGYESLIDGQTCLEDANADGLLDRAVLLGEGNVPRGAGTIATVPYSTLAFEAIDPATDSLRISLRSVRANNVRLEVTSSRMASARPTMCWAVVLTRPTRSWN